MSYFYKNEYLFSEIYLREITEIEEEPGVVATLTALKEYRDYASTASLQEWNKSFIHEVLNALQFGLRKINENVALLYQLGRPDQIISICFSLLPSENLDNTSMGRNWSERIIWNLRNNGLNWGILTNGEKWRIYYTEEDTPYENYLEIDFANILNSYERRQFQIFHKFMRAENFVNKKDGICQFDIFKRESQEKINYIEEELKKALKQKEEGGKGILFNLCMGYVEYLRKIGQSEFSDEDMRKAIYGSAMLYMFRLLFLFYAVARDLLSEGDCEIFNSSLKAAEKICKHGLSGNVEYKLWEDLRALFSNIDLSYNGGLFNPEENKFTKFIEKNKIVDFYLAPVLYYMTYYESENGDYLPISYRDMGVRHLGTLYEGLLEHRLFIAEEDTEVRIKGKELKFIPFSEGGKLIQGKYIPEGQVYFGTDKKGRKSSGLYYTPEYIVDYIVTNTVGEKLKELFKDFSKKSEAIVNALETAIDKDEQKTLKRLLKTNLIEFVSNKILKLSVLDPAMGSGHFLVNATNQIANFITEFLNKFDIVEEDDTSVGHWRRRVIENCIYGVDINPLAIELANLSLWILSVAKERPLSFLNHHLKCGNSLVGAKLVDVGQYPLSRKERGNIQKDLFIKNENFNLIVENVISNYRRIESIESDKLDDIEEKRQWLNMINSALVPYKSLCNYHTDVYFKNEVSEDEYNDRLSTFNKDFNWEKDSFFHWELEFPKVMIKERGFSIVIGNPPWGAASTQNEKRYFRQQYNTTTNDRNGLNGSLNTFSLFMERSVSLLNKDDHSFGFILPLSFVTTAAMQKIQKHCFQANSTFKVLNFSERPGKVFPGVEQPVSICFLKVNNDNRQDPAHFFSTGLIKFKQNELPRLLKEIETTKVPYEYVVLGKLPKISSNLELSILQKVKSLRNSITNYFDLSETVHGENNIFYKTAGGRYYKPFTLFFNGVVVEGNPQASTTQGILSVYDQYLLKPISAVLNSSLFFWIYQVYSDCWHLLLSDFNMFHIDIKKFSNEQLSKLSILNDELMNNFRRNSKLKVNIKGSKKIEYTELYARHGKKIIDEVDKTISISYGLTKIELDHILNYRRGLL